jgi:hypothetical protein
MGNIILELNPCCRLYIAKVTDDRPGPIAVAEAVHWAVQQQVDLINLSLVLFEEHTKVLEAIQAANDAGVVVICSTADRGFIRQDVWPAKYASDRANSVVIPIAACRANGKISEFSSETTAKYVFQGENVEAGEAPISGSSVATAIATGIASLVLGCHRSLRRLHPSSPYRTKTNYSLITNVFSKMGDKDSGKDPPQLVKPWLVFPTKKLVDGVAASYKSDYMLSEIDQMDEWIEKRFIPSKSDILVLALPELLNNDSLVIY